MSDTLWANILTAIPVTIAALASLVIAFRTQHKVEKVERSVNGLLAERDRFNRAIGSAAGEIVGERRAEDVETARRLREQLRRGSREVGPHE